MTYTPFARKYRPRFFREVVGQEVAVRILKNAVSLGKVSHAYLFAGPRGVGKTTIARILSKALNCLNLKGGEPCGECENCKEIERGSFPDVVEMDAASNRGIDDIRALKEAVSYTPIKGKHKVYIIDEAHMLTKEAFNALLKTLEEPPPRTTFILCTTEYDKIPPTILSRCQRIIFGRLEEEKVISYLESICKKEGIDYEPKALKLIAKASEGCLRDAASLLDQASLYGDGKVTAQVIEGFLGILGEEKVREFIKLLLDSEVDKALGFLNDLYKRGYNLSKFWELVEEELRNAILCKSMKDPSSLVENPEAYKEFSAYPLEALLYLENLINRGKLEAKVRTPLRAYELAVIKSLIVKEILPLSKILTGPIPAQKDEEKPKSLEDKVKDLLSPLAFKAFRDAPKERRDWKLIVKMEESVFESFKAEFEKLKGEGVEFEVYKKKEERKGTTTSLF